MNSQSLFIIHLCNWGGWAQGGSRLPDSFCTSALFSVGQLSNSVLMNFLIYKEMASPELMDWTQDCMHARKGLDHCAASLTLSFWGRGSMSPTLLLTSVTIAQDCHPSVSVSLIAGTTDLTPAPVWIHCEAPAASSFRSSSLRPLSSGIKACTNTQWLIIKHFKTNFWQYCFISIRWMVSELNHKNVCPNSGTLCF